MSRKIICISDIHIDDYRHYNPSDEEFHNLGLCGVPKDYRLNQCLILAAALVNFGQKNGIRDLFLLGDMYNTAILHPKVYWTGKKFVNTLSEWFKIRYILGQHDMAVKVDDIEPENTFVRSLDNPNFIYMHRKFEEIDGIRMKFMNWVPQTEIDFNNCDIALGHVSIGLSQVPIGNYSLGIFGDIHDLTEIPHMYEGVRTGTDYSIGTPYQLYPAQDELGHIGLLDLENMSFSRIESDSLLS